MKMPKIMIAVPVYDAMSPEFVQCLMGLKSVGETRIAFQIGSLVHFSRELLLQQAVENDVDYIVWFDSDMTFLPDTVTRLIEDVLTGKDFVSAMCFRRKFPTNPVALKSLEYDPVTHEEHQTFYTDYPKDTIFQVDAIGLAVAITKVDMLVELAIAYGESVFQPLPGMGEDWSLCWKMKQKGIPVWCDSRIKTGHVGKMIFTEKVWQGQMERKDDEEIL